MAINGWGVVEVKKGGIWDGREGWRGSLGWEGTDWKRGTKGDRVGVFGGGLMTEIGSVDYGFQLIADVNEVDLCVLWSAQGMVSVT